MLLRLAALLLPIIIGMPIGAPRASIMAQKGSTALEYRAQQTYALTAGNTHNVSVPTHASGDTLVAIFSYSASAGAANTVAGWTKRAEASGSSIGYVIFTRPAGTEPATYTFTWTAGGGQVQGVMLSYKNGNGVNITGNSGNHSGTFGTVPGVTTTVAKTILLGIAVAAGDATVNQLSGFSARTDLTTVGGQTLRVGEEARPTAGATGDRTMTGTDFVEKYGVLIALAPV